MQSILVYDTETTGLPVWSSPSEDPCQPRVTQIAAELCDQAGATLAGMNVIIRPDGWTIPDDIAELTGITMEKAMDVGVPIQTALPMFIELWQLANVHRVGHNESFDMRMIRIELMRIIGYGVDFADKWKAGAAFCTQSKSTKIVNASRPDAEKKKTANLRECYKHFTGLDLVGAHNAANDIMATKAVYFALQNINAGAAE